MGAFLRKYGTGTGADVYVPMIKRAVVDYAVSADWTPAAGDVKISKDGAAAANIGTLPVAVAMGNTAMWKFVFTDTELQAKVISVTVADAATKAVEDQMFDIETYGNASALHPFDLATATQSVTVASGGITSGSFAAGAVNAAAIAADAIGASELAGDAVTEIADGVWNATRSGHTTAGSFGEGVASVQGSVTGSVASVTGAVGSVTGAVGSVTGNVGGNVVGSTASVTGAVTVGTNNDKTGYRLSPAGVDDVWDELRSGHTAAGSFGEGVASVQGSVTGSVGSVSGAVGSVSGAVGSVTGNVGGNVVGSVGSVTAPVTAGTVSDKTGYALSAAGVDAILDDPLTELTAVPAAAPSLRQALQYVYQRARNKVITTATQTKEHNDAGTVVGTATVSDDGTTTTRDKFA